MTQKIGSYDGQDYTLCTNCCAPLFENLFLIFNEVSFNAVLARHRSGSFCSRKESGFSHMSCLLLLTRRDTSQYSIDTGSLGTSPAG